MITFDERIRELCIRVLASKGAEFHTALRELQQAIEARVDAKTNGNNFGESGG